MAFPDNRVDQSRYKASKGLTNKSFCWACKEMITGMAITNANGNPVHPSCAGSVTRGVVDDSQGKPKGRAKSA